LLRVEGILEVGLGAVLEFPTEGEGWL